jgi:hypothetical protein
MIVADGTTAPEGSVTVPVRVPLLVCPKAAIENKEKQTANKRNFISNSFQTPAKESLELLAPTRRQQHYTDPPGQIASTIAHANLKVA